MVMIRRLIIVVTLLAIVFVAAIPAPAAAHPLLNTAVILSIHETTVTATIEIPLSELGVALSQDFARPAQQVLNQDSRLINDYIRQHFQPTSPNGKPWNVRIGQPRIADGQVIKTGSNYKKWVVPAVLTPPAGSSTRTFSLGYDAVGEKVKDHLTLISIRQDWASGITGQHPAQVGIIAYNLQLQHVENIRIDVSAGNWLTGFTGMIKLGMEHIRTGTDHLLFLFTLLLPAPLLIAGRRWRGYAGWRDTFRHIISIATAFTVGHSLTLIVVTLASLRISPQPIEALIAVSIIVSAVHAVRPLFPGKEVWVAAGFGLIHGTAFSFTLAELQLGRGQLVTSLFGFNIGIELMQLLIILLVMPSLIVLARFPGYRWIRTSGAVLALTAACGWLAARLGRPNAVGTFADSLSSYAYWSVIALGATAAIVLLRTYYAAHPAGSPEDSGPPKKY